MRTQASTQSPPRPQQAPFVESPIVTNINSFSRNTLEGFETGTSVIEQSLNKGAREVLETIADTTENTQRTLNEGAENVFASIKSLISSGANMVNQTANVGLAYLAGVGAEYRNKQHEPAIEAIEPLANRAGIIANLAEKAVTSSGRASLVNNWGLALFNAGSGVLSTLSEFSEEYKNPNSDYSKTLLRATSASTQSIITGYGGVAAWGAATSGAAASAVLFPAIAAVTVAAGIGYAADKWISSN